MDSFFHLTNQLASWLLVDVDGTFNFRHVSGQFRHVTTAAVCELSCDWTTLIT